MDSYWFPQLILQLGTRPVVARPAEVEQDAVSGVAFLAQDGKSTMVRSKLEARGLIRPYPSFLDVTP